MKEKYLILNIENGFYLSHSNEYGDIFVSNSFNSESKIEFDSEEQAIGVAKRTKNLKYFSIVKFYTK